MLIAVSGSQGAGKSTTIHALVEKYDLKVIERQTARSVLTDWGVSMEEVFSDTDLICKFQAELLQRKFQDEQEARDSNDLWITERTYMDLLAYTVANVGRFNKHSNWLDCYHASCVENQKHYDCVVYLKGGLFSIKDDGVRPTNTHYSTMIDSFMESYTRDSSCNRLSVIITPNLTDRLDIINTHIIEMKKINDRTS